jgi:hypothetical protein
MYHLNQSPGSTRGYGGNGQLNRQPSRHFDNHGTGQLQGLYTADDYAARHDGLPRFDYRMQPSATVHSNYGYDNQTWNYGGTNGVNLMGGTARIKQQSRRGNIPSVSFPYSHVFYCRLILILSRGGWIQEWLKLRACNHRTTTLARTKIIFPWPRSKIAPPRTIMAKNLSPLLLLSRISHSQSRRSNFLRL